MKYYLAAALVAILAAGCSGQSQTSTSTNSPSDQSTMTATNPPGAPTDSITLKLNPLNGSGESGTATLTPMGNRTRVVIGITGENATGKQPAHIHKGTCAKLNPVPTYPLKDVVLGKSNTIVDVPIDKLTVSPMAVNVHESAKNIKRYVACGDIKPGP
jgi:hypothetical protein